MDLTEIIGFIIGLIALLFLYIQRVREEHKRRRDPAAAQQEEAQRKRDLKSLLKSMDLDLVEEEERYTPPPPKPVAKQHHKKTSSAPLPQKIGPLPKIEVPKSISASTPISTLQGMFKDTDSVRKAIIMREVLGPPRAYRPYEPLQ